MYVLKNAQLELAILDPVADQSKLGGRYCSGGYVYQVVDRTHGPLLSGPAYPQEPPPPFHGQGLPEAFRDGLGPGDDEAVILALGVGLVTRKAREVKQFCAWNVAQEANAITMSTVQTHLDWAVQLTRKVVLANRTVKSINWLKNTGKGEIPVRWFPHPFFPLTEDGECCKLSFPVCFPENAGYEWRESGFIGRKLAAWSARGHFQALDFATREALWIAQRHPRLGLIVASTDYAPTSLPIWGNANTFSFEPYYERTFWPGQEASWSVSYEF